MTNKIITDVLNPAFENNNVSIVFSIDKGFVPYLDVCIKSLIANSNKENNYGKWNN